MDEILKSFLAGVGGAGVVILDVFLLGSGRSLPQRFQNQTRVAVPVI